MRYTSYITSVVLLLICCPAIAAAEGAGSWLWPFGGQKQTDDTPAATAAVAPTTTTVVPTVPTTPTTSATPTVPTMAPSQSVADSELTSGGPVKLPDIRLPHYEPRLPTFALPRLWPKDDEADDARNAWAKPSDSPEQNSPWKMVKDGAHRLGTGTRNAWDKTVDVLNPFDNADQPVAHHQPRSTLWNKLFPADNEPQRARTITEWMAQERLDP